MVSSIAPLIALNNIVNEIKGAGDIPTLLNLMEEFGQALDESFTKKGKQIEETDALFNAFFEDCQEELGFFEKSLTVYEFSLAMRNAFRDFGDHLQEYDLYYWSSVVNNMRRATYVLSKIFEGKFKEDEEVKTNDKNIELKTKAILIHLKKESLKYGPIFIRNKLIGFCDHFQEVLLSRNIKLQELTQVIKAEANEHKIVLQYDKDNHPQDVVDIEDTVNQYMTLDHIKEVLRGDESISTRLQYVHDILDTSKNKETDSNSVWGKILHKLSEALSMVTSLLFRHKVVEAVYDRTPSMDDLATSTSQLEVFDPETFDKGVGSEAFEGDPDDDKFVVMDKPRRASVMIRQTIASWDEWEAGVKKDILAAPPPVAILVEH